MATTRKPTYWCANFDCDDVLEHGLRIDAWLLQYQYEHGGFEYEGNRRQKGQTMIIWKTVAEVEIGDWLIAYLSRRGFFAVGQVVEPRRRSKYFDTVERTLRERCHLNFDGIVRYEDAPALYEDFTDRWKHPTKQSKKDPGFLRYAQRIDVAHWQHRVPDGLKERGLASAAPLPLYRRALFPVDAGFFVRISTKLKSACSRL